MVIFDLSRIADDVGLRAHRLKCFLHGAQIGHVVIDDRAVLNAVTVILARLLRQRLFISVQEERDCRIELYDCAHVELPEMRKLILEWMDRHLVEEKA